MEFKDCVHRSRGLFPRRCFIVGTHPPSPRVLALWLLSTLLARHFGDEKKGSKCGVIAENGTPKGARLMSRPPLSSDAVSGISFFLSFPSSLPHPSKTSNPDRREKSKPKKMPSVQLDEERERRAAAAEARMRAQQRRGQPSAGSNSSSGSRHADRGSPTAATEKAKEPPRPSPAPVSTQASQQQQQAQASPPRAPGPNPALEAAQLRQQQQQKGTRPGVQMSDEKRKLLHEIDAILKRHGETEPFGLRSADEMKLRNYWGYLKEKYSEA